MLALAVPMPGILALSADLLVTSSAVSSTPACIETNDRRAPVRFVRAYEPIPPTASAASRMLRTAWLRPDCSHEGF